MTEPKSLADILAGMDLDPANPAHVAIAEGRRQALTMADVAERHVDEAAKRAVEARKGRAA